MKVIWTHFAVSNLKQIVAYYKEKASPVIAQKIKSDIFSATKQLVLYPHSGQEEETLERLNEGHRYLVQGNYKIIYKEVKEGILITDVFDTRQDPVKINDENRNQK